MALIQYTINKDAAGWATVTYSVQSIGPGDQITFVTDTPGVAIQCEGDSPFQDPPVGGVYSVPARGAKQQPLPVVKPIDGSKAFTWQCGSGDGGKFTAWPGAGPAFPPIGGG